MTGLDQYFKQPNVISIDPQIRYLHEQIQQGKAVHAQCVFVRKREGLTFGPAKLFLTLLDSDGNAIEQPFELAWDPEVNEELLNPPEPVPPVRAESPENESERFGLMLYHKFERVVERVDDAFFNAVLVEYLGESPFASNETVAFLLQRTDKPSRSSKYRDYCRDKIEEILVEMAHILTEKLHYDQKTAEQILTDALAYYLDERFSITYRRLLGFA